ncbi:DNA/RNA non-specific endonuclease [Agrococcus sp. ARC_14]|uniref:DNA/RNA non-specific endonuclease n=1 Tax=Agrococcus sp. ARC_14 TaxID=2919927 RepID=UPI001F05226A|nr:DNA/RNA non-specific endonuclease [Agrococcus sp. ARC_14]MCH1883283.1 DNA/RNA non-specific endonuclease [Agrococcus sp. ARC_14]
MSAARARGALGYDPAFLGEQVAAPTPVRDADAPVLDSMHFTVTMHTERRLAWSVAWNVDGLRFFPNIPRARRFFADDRLPLDEQTTEAVYADNDLDRGHLARRADLLWGTLADAKQANLDSFCFTNISPQMAGFNQSSRGGVWGELEDGVLDMEELVDRRISVFGGPVLADDDPHYRDLVQVPRDHWKAVVYRVGDALRSKAFLLTQDLDGLRTAYLDAFDTFELSLDDLAARTGLDFAGLPGAAEASAREQAPRRIERLAAIRW